MQKFVIDRKGDYAAHYSYCAQHRVPFVRVIPAIKYARIEFDVYELVKPQGLSDEQPYDFIIDLYQAYARFVGLPTDRFSCVGGANNLISTVYKEHAEPFAAQLYDYLLRFIASQQRQGLHLAHH
jgi:hypothetical protein